MTQPHATAPSHSRPHVLVPTVTAAVVRYQVADVERAVAFYSQRLGFKVELQAGSVFASVARGDLHLLLSGPEASGGRPMPDGRKQGPGGWNRIVLYVEDMASLVASLRRAGVRLLNDVETGPGGSQLLLRDPDRNPD